MFSSYSLIKDSTTSTILLQDFSSNSAINNNHYLLPKRGHYQHRHHHHKPHHCQKSHKKPNNIKCNSVTTSKSLLSMTETNLAPFGEASEPPENGLSAINDYYARHEKNLSLFFEDGLRSIDFVLVFRLNTQLHIEEANAEKRRVYEGNLELEGLEIERAFKEKEQIYFVKVKRVNLRKQIFRRLSSQLFSLFFLSDPCTFRGFKTICRNFEITYAYEGGKIRFLWLWLIIVGLLPQVSSLEWIH